MTKKELIAASAGLPDDAPVLIVPVPRRANVKLMLDDLPATAYRAKQTDEAFAGDSGQRIAGAFLALAPIVE